MDLYATLGVRKNASSATIRKAYRKRARQTHPDVGGDADEFRRVQLANAILSDPERRARYNSTGDASEVGPDNAVQDCLAVLAECMIGVLMQVESQGARPKYIDLVGLMRQGLGNALKDLDKQCAAFAKPKSLLEETIGRFSADEGPNYMEGLVRGHLQSLEQKAKQIEVHRERVTRAMEFLKRFKYRKDQSPQEIMRAASRSWTRPNGTQSATIIFDIR